MELPKHIHDRLAVEFRLVADKMKEEASPFRKVYFFSAIYADLVRVLNWSWDEDLVLLHAVTQATYERINTRLELIAQGRDRALQISPRIFDQLTETVDDLARFFEGNGTQEEMYSLLCRFSKLSYATTGNGHYLTEKGTLKI